MIPAQDAQNTFTEHTSYEKVLERYNAERTLIKNENNGSYEAALMNYNHALAEVEKYKFHEKMKQQLLEKIKVLKSAIEYESH